MLGLVEKALPALTWGYLKVVKVHPGSWFGGKLKEPNSKAQPELSLLLALLSLKLTGSSSKADTFPMLGTFAVLAQSSVKIWESVVDKTETKEYLSILGYFVLSAL